MLNVCLFKLSNNFNARSPYHFFDTLAMESLDGNLSPDGVAMGSPLGLTLASASLCPYEKEELDNCPIHFKPVIYQKYVDDIFVLFSSKGHLQRFVDYMNKQHKCLKFTSEAENSVLDIKITRHNQRFKTSVHRKSTFSGVFTHYESDVDQAYKRSLIDT